MKKRSQYIWLLKNCCKNTNHIKLDGRQNIYPNRCRMKIKNIVMITTKGKDIEKNYCKIFLTKKRYFYIYSSMQKLKIRLGKLIIQVNKSTFVNPSQIDSSLDLKYLFSKHLDKPIKVGTAYIKDVEKYF